MFSSTIRCFSAADQRRRRPPSVMISISDMSMCLRLSLSLLGQAKVSGRNGGQFRAAEVTPTIVQTLGSGSRTRGRWYRPIRRALFWSPRPDLPPSDTIMLSRFGDDRTVTDDGLAIWNAPWLNLCRRPYAPPWAVARRLGPAVVPTGRSRCHKFVRRTMEHGSHTKCVA